MYRLALPLLIFLGVLSTQPGEPKQAAPPRPVLPGAQPDGSVKLPNQWSLRPAGRQLELGDFPVSLALHPSGRWLAVTLTASPRNNCRIPRSPKNPAILRTISSKPGIARMVLSAARSAGCSHERDEI